MKKIILIPLIIIIVGAGLALAGWAAGGLNGAWFDGGSWHLANAERGELIKVDETYDGAQNIDVRADFIRNVVFKEGDEFRVLGENYKGYGGIDVSLAGNTLAVTAKQHKDGLIIDFNFGRLWDNTDTWLEITYPKGTTFSTVNVEVNASDIDASALDCGNLTIHNDFGDVDVRDITSDNANITADAGRVGVTGAVIKGQVNIENNFGDVRLKNVDAGDLYADLDAGDLRADDINAKTTEMKNDFGKIIIDGAEADDMTLELSAGDLSGDNITAGDLHVRNNFGKVSFQHLLFTGLCEVDFDSGDADIGLNMNETDLSYELQADAGSIRIDGRNMHDSVSRDSTGSDAKLIVDSNFGSVDVRFAA